MYYRRLGSTDLNLSVMALGTVKLGRNTAVKYPATFEIPGDDDVRALLAQARDLGINTLDTAPAYGDSESRLGRLLPGQRRDWILCSKAGEYFDPATGVSTHDFRPEAIEHSIFESLTRLRTDYLDLVLIHSNGEDLKIINTMGALEVLADLKCRGIIRSFGMSTKTVEGGIAALNLSDCAMVTLNQMYREEVPVIEHAAKTGKGILIKKALASGHNAYCASGASPLEAAFRLGLSLPAVTSLVIGTISPEHLASNAAIADRVCAELAAANKTQS